MISMLLSKLDRPLNVLCLGAHCDDIEIGCGGTVLRLMHDYPDANVQWIVFSSNRVRRAEFKNSSRSFLGKKNASLNKTYEFKDGYFPNTWKDIKDVFEKIKPEMAPDLIFTHFRDDLHQDHRIISELTWNTFRNHLILEYEVPKYDGDFGSPNFFMQLSEEVCQRKILYLMNSYASQTSKGWFDEDMFRSVLRLRGMEANSPTRLAEGFYARKLVT
jgi:LmbE family N-acetylglucosaminyl deacetylase